MSGPALGDFLTRLEQGGGVARVRGPVDPRGELADLARYASRLPDGGPVLLFENVSGASVPVVANLFGSPARVRALTGGPEEVASIVSSPSRENASQWWRSLLPLTALEPADRPARKVIRIAPCQQVVKFGRDLRLAELPIPRLDPLETQSVIWGTAVWIRDPETGQQHVSSPPVQIVGPQQLVCRWQEDDPALEFRRRAASQHHQLSIGIQIGGDPVWTFALPLGRLLGIDPMSIVRGLRNEDPEFVRCRTHEVEVPAHAEFVLEAQLDPEVPTEPVPPILLPTGRMSEPVSCQPATVTALTQRGNPLLPVQVIGEPPHEADVITRESASLLEFVIRRAIPGVRAYHLVSDGGLGRVLRVSMVAAQKWQPRQIMHALWGHPLFCQVRLIVVVDEAVDPANDAATWREIAAWVDWENDVVTTNGALHPFDVESLRAGFGGRLGIDATRKSRGPKPNSPNGNEEFATRTDPAQVRARWRELGLPSSGK